MKKTLLGILAAAFCTSAIAQSSLRIYDGNNIDVTGTVIMVYQDTSTYNSTNFYVKNISANNISSKARKEEVTMANGSSCSICYATTCYPASVYMSTCKPHTAGASLTLACDFTFGNVYTTSIVHYTVYNCSNSADSATLTLQYYAAPAGIQNHALSFSIGDAYPNPASSTLSFNYKISNTSSAPHITIHNLLGNLVKSAEMTESNGTARMDISDLEEGLYFYTLEVNNRPLAVKKFIVRR